MRKSLLLLAALAIATAVPFASSAFDGRSHWHHEGWHYYHHHWYPRPVALGYPGYYYPPYAYAPSAYVAPAPYYAPAPMIGVYGRF